MISLLVFDWWMISSRRLAAAGLSTNGTVEINLAVVLGIEESDRRRSWLPGMAMIDF